MVMMRVEDADMDTLPDTIGATITAINWDLFMVALMSCSSDSTFVQNEGDTMYATELIDRVRQRIMLQQLSITSTGYSHQITCI